MKNKIKRLIVILVLLVIIFFPIQINKLKDGESVEYKTLLYSITKYYKLDENVNGGYVKGIGIKIFGKEIFNNIKNQEENNKIVQDHEESFVATVLEETTKYMIVEPNEDEKERKSSNKIKINFGTGHVDYLYGIGRKVVIHYTGDIMETYPAQINTNKIETEGYRNFEITVKKSNDHAKRKILNNKDLAADDQDFNLYYYGLDAVNVKVDNQDISLEEALRSGKITLNGIVAKANTDFSNALTYNDGGSSEYHYKDYTIIKVHKLDGNRDVYIGNKDMTINDLGM